MQANLVYDGYFVQYDVVRELMLLYVYNNLTREYVYLSKRKQIVKLHKPKRLIICSIYRVSNQEDVWVKHAAPQQGLRKCSGIRSFNQNPNTGLMNAVMNCEKQR
jgi:hypothetical protein